ncbi:MAG: ribosome hibernation-promoting factor, HPF/YfiA family [Candidatus Eisenbacteria bacterium]|nr:ribosome-associated translation inhibitor RaiA [Candidatus Eisenbacteria bacterium]
MDIITTARRYELTPQLRERVEKRLQKLDRYSDQIQEVHLVLAQEKHRQIAEVTVRANGTDLISRQESHDMLSSIDQVVDRLERQLKKWNTRMRDRKTRKPVPAGVPVEEEELSTVEAEEEWAPVVVRGKQWHPEAVTVEEAIRILREGDSDFLMFRNARSGKVSLVHLREDGNFGLVEAE